MEKIISFDDLAVLKKRHPGQRIVHCHGVFDLLHHGHLLHLKSAKKNGDVLVVTVTPDRFVNKGPGRPRFSQGERAAMLAALELVDYVAINKYSRGTEPIRILRPHCYAKGPDYKKLAEDITGGIQEEKEAVESVGGKLVFTNDDTESATELINAYLSTFDEEQRTAISTVKQAMSLGDILRSIDALADLRVLVIGEPIVDTYIFCQPEALSSKSPTVSARFLNQEDYAGGSLAIANNLAALGCSVTLLMTHGGESYFRDLLKKALNPKVTLEDEVIKDIPTPRKTRFLMPFHAQRMFELIDVRADQWMRTSPKHFCDRMKKLSMNFGSVLVADFGHGMFEGSVLDSLRNIKPFVALNVQTNSGNFGFNPFTKHRRYDYLVLDERECRIATHDRFTAAEKLARNTIKKLIKKPTSITLGAAGSIYFDGNREYHCPTFFKEIVDTTGAGDAYLALTSLLVQQKLPGAVIPFLGNCYAGLKTRIIGNKSAVSKVDFIRTVKSILQ